MTREETNIGDLIDRRGMSPLAIWLIVLCGLIILIDGFDVQAIGFAASAISDDLGIAIEDFGPVFSAGLFGAMFGALLLGPMADKVGRKPMLLASTLLFAVFTLLTPISQSVTHLIILRFVAGIGLGGAIPNVISLVTEYVPTNRRGLAIGTLYAGYPLGGMIGGFTSAEMIPAYGWHPLFIIGGAIPLVLALLVAFTVPESWQFLLAKGGAGTDAKVRRIVGRLAPIPEGTQFQQAAKATSNTSVKDLVTEGRLGMTGLLWTAFAMVQILLIVMVLWTPALLTKAGVMREQAAVITALINLGSAAGTILVGRFIDKVGHKKVIPAVLILGACFVAPIGLVAEDRTILSVFAVLGGFFVGSAASGLLIVAALAYPASMRGTGIGWAYSAGRVGQVFGPMIAGGMLASGYSVPQIFLAAIVPSLICAAAVLRLRLPASA